MDQAMDKTVIASVDWVLNKEKHPIKYRMGRQFHKGTVVILNLSISK